MKLILLILFFAFSFAQIQCTTTKYVTNDDGDNSDAKPNYAAIVGILGIVVIQLILCKICYNNTNKLRIEAQALRAEIGAEYDAIQNAQFQNMNQMCQFNYFLVYPNDPRFQFEPPNNNFPL